MTQLDEIEALARGAHISKDEDLGDVTTGGELHRCAFRADDEPIHILNIGCGTGSWAKDMAL